MSRRKQVIVLTLLAGLWLVALEEIVFGEGGWLMWMNLFLLPPMATLFIREWRQESA